MAYLEYFEEGLRAEHKLLQKSTTIGRSHDCSLKFPHDPEMSRVHCRIESQEDGTFVLVDANAKNGTFLDETRILGEPVQLTDGATIRVGRTVFTFVDRDQGFNTVILREVEEERKDKGFHTIMLEAVRDAKEVAAKKAGRKSPEN